MRFPGFFHTGPLLGPSAPPVLTTADVLPQERWRIFPSVSSALIIACKRATGGKNLPMELAILILEMAKVGMTRAEAEGHRRALMNDRRAAVEEVNYQWEDFYGLCEH